MRIIVETSKAILKIGRKSYPCSIGKNGVALCADGREGDGKTPLGKYALRYGLYRADRVKLPRCALEFHPIQKNDGWCDAPENPAYNRPVQLPYSASAEHLYKDSQVYDIIIVLGHNDSPPIADMGSAIFLHVARDGMKPTEGCVAICLEDMLEILPKLKIDTQIEINP